MLLTKKTHSTSMDSSIDSQHTIDISSTDYMNLQELHAYQKIKSKLSASAQNLSKLQQGDEELNRSSSLNTDIYNRYISCTQDVPYNATNELSQFIERLIDNTAARQKDCMHRIQAIIDHYLSKI